MRDEADLNFFLQFHWQNAVCHRRYQSSTYPSPTPKHCHIFSLTTSRLQSTNSSIRKTRRHISCCQEDAKQTRKLDPYSREMPETGVDCGESLLPSSKTSSEGGGGGENARRRPESWFDVGSKDFHQSEREEPKPLCGRGREADERPLLPAQTGSNPMRVPRRL